MTILVESEHMPKNSVSAVTAARSDFVTSLLRRDVWLALAWQDIRLRYKRSVLGPFWITLTMLITICGLGPLYGTLFKLDLSDFIPFLALGLIAWGLISSIILEGCATFLESDSLIRSVSLPTCTYIFRITYRNVLTFMHNLVAYVPVLLFFHIQPEWKWLLAIPGVVLIILAAIPASVILGIFCARFRDMQPIVANITQVVFFLTPIFWKPELLKEHAFLANFNPLYLFLEIVRGPIYGKTPALGFYLGAGGVTVFLYVVAIPLFVKYRRRIAFWV